MSNTITVFLCVFYFYIYFLRSLMRARGQKETSDTLACIRICWKTCLNTDCWEPSPEFLIRLVSDMVPGTCFENHYSISYTQDMYTDETIIYLTNTQLALTMCQTLYICTIHNVQTLTHLLLIEIL